MGVDGVGKRIALTFDDGPSPYNTDPILRALAKAGVTATFFMIGVNVRAWPSIARRVRDAGHEIGNHSVYHTPYRSSSLASQIGPNQKIIKDATGVTPVVSRAPGLTRGSIILSTCAQHGMYECHTSYSSSDWKAPRWSASRLLSEFNSVRHSGWIGLYHDGGERRPTQDLVPYMLSSASSAGYSVMGATQLVNLGTPRPGRQSYSNSRSSSRATALDAIEDPLFESRCSYDPRAELLLRLDDPTVKADERSRIVEVLADIEAQDAEDFEQCQDLSNSVLAPTTSDSSTTVAPPQETSTTSITTLPGPSTTIESTVPAATWIETSTTVFE